MLRSREEEEEWDEETQLRELNSRLRLYVCRVRELEQENRLLAQELAELQQQELAGLRGPQQELAELRGSVAELSRAKREAELERDGLRQELGQLELLAAEVLQLRRRLAPELAGQRQLLERLWGECAALEELLQGLRAEHGQLLARQRREAGEVRALRLELAALPPPLAGLSLEQLEETYERVLGQACRESLLRYQGQLRALQEREARLGRESLEQVRAEGARGRRRLDELRRQGQQLGGLGQRLEEELLALRELHGAEADEYQRIIDALEEEKQFLTMSIMDYLKDYNELMQVKVGLSLEVETYRTLLEGESSQWIITWIDQQGRKIPQGVRNASYDYTNSYSAYREENKKKSFPIIKSADIRHKTPVTNIRSSVLYSTPTRRGGPRTTDSEKVLRKDILSSEYHPSTTIEKDATYERTMKDHREFKTFTPSYSLWGDTEIHRKTFPERKRTEATTTSAISFSKELTSVQSSKKDHKIDTRSGVSESTRTKPDNFTKFPSYELNSNFKQTKYEQTLDDTRAILKEKTKGDKPVKEGKSGLLEEKDKQPVNEERNIVLEKKEMDDKPTRAERSVNFGKKTEVKPEKKTHIMEEVIINDNKKIFSGVRSKEDSTAKEEKNVTWEEQTRVHKSAREGEFFLPDAKIKEDELTKRNTNVFLESRSKEAVEIPISVEMYTPDKILQNSNTEITFQGFKTSVGRETDEHTIKPVEILSVNVSEKEPNLEDEHGISDKSSPRMGTLSTENIAETIVADILKSFVQSSGSETTPHTKVNYLEKKKQDDEKETTEITVQSQVQEEISISDEVDLGSLLNKDGKVVLEDAMGIPSKDVIEDIINVGLKGRDRIGKVSVNVEIVEEPLESATDERSEFSTPFEVEEVEDTSPGIEQHYGDEGEQNITATAEDFKKKKQSSEILTHVEEVTEADDSIDEQRYFVSTPDDHPLAHGKDDDSVYGQIHIEEESTIKYSWQDEFLRGTQRRKDDSMSSPEQTYQVVGEEASAYVLNEEHPKGEASHAESIVIEKEIKIPHEFQASIKGLLLKETKDPKQQLKEALEQLEGSLPESVKEELAALTKENHADSSSLAVDIKKVEQTNEDGLVTIVAEVNLTQTLDTDQFDIAQLGGVITSEIEKVSPKSPKQEGFDEHNDPELERRTDGKSSIETDISPSSNKSTSWASQGVYSSSSVRSKDGMEYHSTEQVIREGPVSEAVEFGNAEEVSQSQVSTDINKSIRHIKIGPTEIRRTEQVIYEGPISETLELGGRGDLVQTEGSLDTGRSVKLFKMGPKEIQTTEEIIYKGPVTKTVAVDESENLAQPQFSADINRSMRHITLGSQQITEDIIFKGPISDSLELSSSGDLSHTEGSTDTNRSIRHIRLSPKEIHTEQIIFEGPISGNVELSGTGDLSQTGSSIRHIKLGQKEINSAEKITYGGPLSEKAELGSVEDSSQMEHRSDTNASIRHIKLGPKEFMTTEQIIYQGPISEHLEFSESGDNFHSEGSIKHITLGQKQIKTTEQVVYQGSISESPEISSAGGSLLESEGNSDINRSIRLIKLSPTETHTEQIIFKGPISETMGDHFQTEGSSESSRSIRHIKLGPQETSFTFQMDVTNVAGVPVVEGRTQAATVTVSNRKEPDVRQSQVVVESDQKDTDSESTKEASVFPDASQAHGEQVTEKSAFEKTVQLQRLVDQRSVISDEKKIALVYLDKEEEGEEDNDGHWF
ncbi:LOW QUALITY PROTEIN: synemin [Mauremys mutica]|uniref:LOW QUALITY PROTEIN: synemin n=1 Tax=Mauremys mutica TaxID=74926 RepID=UPI001D15B5E3|nr:LOW QUALITY PROTEIN: synemin [Mauremys mutica]